MLWRVDIQAKQQTRAHKGTSLLQARSPLHTCAFAPERSPRLYESPNLHAAVQQCSSFGGGDVMDVFSGQSSGKLDYLVSCPLPIDACASAFLGAVTTCTTIDLCGFSFFEDADTLRVCDALRAPPTVFFILWEGFGCVCESEYGRARFIIIQSV